MADVLARLGGVPEERLVLLRGPTSASVERVLASVGERIRTDRAADPDAEALLFLYYSGHAGVGALHLGEGERLSFSALKEQVEAAGADVSVFVVDACRSGGLTRVKGAVPDAPFAIDVEDKLDSSGLAIITSSAAGEDAQESDRLRGGVFTHHLLTGLVGAADASHDQRVTLSELYRYAYAQTLRTTSKTRFVQHPTYAFRMKGRQELVLTRIAEGPSGYGRLRLGPSGFYVVLEKGAGGSGAVAELDTAGDAEVLLPPGDYLVRLRGSRAVHETSVRVAAGGEVVVGDGDLARVPYGRTVRKGLGETSLAWSLGAAFEAAGPLMNDFTPGLFGAVGVQLDLEALALQLRVRYGRATSSNSDLGLTQDTVGFDLGLLKIFDIEAIDLGLGIGVRLGADWVSQRFETEGSAPSRWDMVGRLAPVGRLEWTPVSAFAVTLDVGADIYLLRLVEDGVTSWDTPVTPFGTLGFAVYLP